MRFPKTIRHRRITATIYGKKPNYPFYRVAFYVAGKRQLRSFKTYKEAKDEAESKVREIADGSQVAGLAAGESRDAIVRNMALRDQPSEETFCAGQILIQSFLCLALDFAPFTK